MPTNKKRTKQSANLGDYLRQAISDRGISLRALAAGAGVSPAYVSEIMNGKNIPEARVCNAIADFLNVPRITIYKLAGWIDSGEDEMLVERFMEAARKNKPISNLIDAIMTLDEPERSEKIRMILAAWGR